MIEMIDLMRWCSAERAPHMGAETHTFTINVFCSELLFAIFKKRRLQAAVTVET